MILMPAIALASSCQVCVEAKWNNVEKSSPQKEKMFGDKLMLVGSITFRKQCKECIKLDRLALEWHGPQITNLCGSLYRRLPEKTFVPIQDNLICDARWNKGSQTLILEFENQQTLNAVSIFYLVLAIPNGLEETLKQGHFTLLDSNLPDQISFSDKKLNLALACQSH
jgi:hypothetical protein